MGADFISKIKELHLPESQFMVTGSGILDVLGIRKADDIDLLVSPELYTKLETKHGWIEYKKYKMTIMHPKGKYGAMQSLNFMKENYTLSELLPTAHVHKGIPFINLEVLKNSKTQLAREKDFRDIKLIDKYLSKNVELIK